MKMIILDLAMIMMTMTTNHLLQIGYSRFLLPTITPIFSILMEV